MKIVTIDFETAKGGTNADNTSACALALTTIQDYEIVRTEYFLIRPPSVYFEPGNVSVHDITWDDVKNEKSFGELIPEFNRIFEGAQYIAAHNAKFDKQVLLRCYAYNNWCDKNRAQVIEETKITGDQELSEELNKRWEAMSNPEKAKYSTFDYRRFNFICTVKMSRKVWGKITATDDEGNVLVEPITAAVVKNNRLPVVCKSLDIPLVHHNARSDAEACAHIILKASRMDNFKMDNYTICQIPSYMKSKPKPASLKRKRGTKREGARQAGPGPGRRGDTIESLRVQLVAMTKRAERRRCGDTIESLRAHLAAMTQRAEVAEGRVRFLSLPLSALTADERHSRKMLKSKQRSWLRMTRMR